MKLDKLVLGAGLAALSLAALATVTFNPANGTGWVGKGDIQVAYGWNNKQLQDAEKAKAISFSFIAVDKRQGVCEWFTETGGKTPVTKVHDVTHRKTTSVNWAVGADPRMNSNGKDGANTGYRLTGWKDSVDAGDIDGDAGLFARYPLVLGGPCPGNEGNGATWSQIIENSSTAGLYVSNNGANPKLLWDPAAVVTTTTTTTAP